MKHSIGQKLILKEDLETEGFLGKKEIRKKVQRYFVTADKEAPRVIHENGDIQLLPKDTKIDGFSAKGIADWIYSYLSKNLPLNDALADYDIEVKDFKNNIVDALEELDFYNADGNIE
jgi:hypothetical protein